MTPTLRTLVGVRSIDMAIALRHERQVTWTTSPCLLSVMITRAAEA